MIKDQITFNVLPQVIAELRDEVSGLTGDRYADYGVGDGDYNTWNTSTEAFHVYD